MLNRDLAKGRDEVMPIVAVDRTNKPKTNQANSPQAKDLFLDRTTASIWPALAIKPSGLINMKTFNTALSVSFSPGKAVSRAHQHPISTRVFAAVVFL